MDVAHAILLYGKIDFSRLTADYLSAKFEIIINDMVRIHIYPQIPIEDNFINIIKIIGHFRNLCKTLLEKPIRISVKTNKIPWQKPWLLAS